MDDPARTRPLLEQYLAGRSEHCPACGYDLRDLKGSICPECAEPLRLRVGLVEDRLGSFLAGLLGLAAASGFGGLLILYIGIWIAMFGPLPVLQFLWLVGSFVVALPLLVLWIRKRRWLRRQPAGRRMLLACLCWLLPPIQLVLLIASSL